MVEKFIYVVISMEEVVLPVRDDVSLYLVLVSFRPFLVVIVETTGRTMGYRIMFDGETQSKWMDGWMDACMHAFGILCLMNATYICILSRALRAHHKSTRTPDIYLHFIGI